jgi:hypothetical protein
MQAAGAVNEVQQACAFRAQGAAVDRVVGVALDVDDALRDVLRASPWLYMINPQPTEQYGQVLRVSWVWASLKWRTCSAKAGVGAMPNAPRLEPARPIPATLKNDDG